MARVLHIQLLGDFRLLHGDTPVQVITSPRIQSLLAYLLLHRDAPQSRQHLAFLFWPDSTEAQARTNLRKLLYQLRQELPDADVYLHADAQTVQWLPGSRFAFDVAEFEAALAEASKAERREDRSTARRALQEAVTTYSGDLLPSCYDDWILPERERLQQAQIDARERLIHLLEVERDYRAAIDHAQMLLRYDPLHEATYRLLMRLHALNDDRASALRTFHSCATALQRELDVEPSPATREAYEQLLQAEALPPPPALRPESVVAFSALVGRDREWMQLQAAWESATSGHPHLVLIGGEAGVGKTRLTEELSRWVGQQGIAAASARCYAAEGELAYAAVVTWLRSLPRASLEPVWRTELARVLPELLVEDRGLPHPAPMTEAWQRQRFFEALARAILSRRQPLLLVLDDVQWCDQGTREWLHYLLRFDPRARLLVVGTVRTEEMAEGHPLLLWMQALRHDEQLTEIDLGPLDESETLELAENVAIRGLDPNLAACIYRETEGNPLFIVEMVRAGLAAGELEPVCPLQELPPRIQGAIEARLAQLSPQARALTELAATIGREFTYPVLAGCSSLSEDERIRALDELWQRRIVQEQGTDAYDFTHDKLRAVAYAAASPARQRLLHERVAETLVAVRADHLDVVSAQVAAHYERAGQAAQAMPYYLRAADAAQRIYAHEEAIGLYERALALSSVSPGQNEWQLEALSGLGRAYLYTGRHDEARQHFGQGLALGREIGASGRILARLCYGLGMALNMQNRLEEMAAVGQEGLMLLGDDLDCAEAALIYDTIARSYHQEGNMPKFLDFTKRTAALLRQLPYTHELSAIYDHVHQAYRRSKMPAEEMAWMQFFEARATAAQDTHALGMVRTEAGEALALQGDLHGAAARLEQALDSAIQTGDIASQSWLHWVLGFTFLALGELAKAERHVRTTIGTEEDSSLTRTRGWGYSLLGQILTCQGTWAEAIDALNKGNKYARAVSDHETVFLTHCFLGRVHEVRGDPARASEQYLDAAALIESGTLKHWRYSGRFAYPLQVARVLRGLEATYDDPDGFRDFCRRFLPLANTVSRVAPVTEEPTFPFVSGFLESAHIAPSHLEPVCHELFEDALSTEWTWLDPFSDCTYTVQEGLEIHAALGRDIWETNHSAPRVLRSMPRATGSPSGIDARPTEGGHLAIQTICRHVSDNVPTIGGLLLWADRKNYLRLDYGMGGPHEITFLGCLADWDTVIGRGRLPDERSVRATRTEDTRPIHLRLERSGERVRAFCSTDGEHWFTVGQATFPGGHPVQVGLYAGGYLDRGVYCDTCPDGTAIRFESFQLWCP